MSRAPRRGRGPQTISHWSTDLCPTGKRAHSTRRSAKAHAARLRPDHLREYQCEQCGYWHVGHLPARVRRGEVTATEYYKGSRSSVAFEPERVASGPATARTKGEPTTTRSVR